MKLSILEGDIFERMKDLPNDSIDLCITSPPYWGLRDYGVRGQLGAEPTMEAYLDNLLRWTKEVYRVLKPTGSFVLNLGDCFVRPTGSKKDNEQTKRDNKGGPADGKYQNHNENFPRDRLGGIYKTKQLLSVSSFAYCKIVSETDFVCRGHHQWLKSNVPSPIRSRLKHSYEALWWFVKDADKYYFDQKPWMQKVSQVSHNRGNYPVNIAHFNSGAQDKSKQFVDCPTETIAHSWRIVPVGEKQKGFELSGKQESMHIAPFPSALVIPYIQSMCPKDGIVLDPFLGSATTMKVALEERRNCIGIELNKDYIEYSKKRLNWGQMLNCECLDTF